MMTESRVHRVDTRLNVIRRYLHIFSLLQNRDDPRLWNASTLADLLQYDEATSSRVLSDKTIRDDINHHLEEVLKVEIDHQSGAKQIRLEANPPAETVRAAAEVYTNFVVNDASRQTAVRQLFNCQGAEGLWSMATLYFAALQRREVSFRYRSYSRDEVNSYRVRPFHLVLRSYNLYLVAAKTETPDRPQMFVLRKIEDLAVAEEAGAWDVPGVDTLFEASWAGFLGGEIKQYELGVHDDALEHVLDTFSSLDAAVGAREGDRYRVTFSARDDLSILKQLFIYGDRVELIRPGSMRQRMIDMLRGAAGIYTD